MQSISGGSRPKLCRPDMQVAGVQGGLWLAGANVSTEAAAGVSNNGSGWVSLEWKEGVKQNLTEGITMKTEAWVS